MCRGFGRTQRAILALIEAQTGPWSVEELCALVYPSSTKPTRSQLNSVTRALHMKLPPRWTFGKLWPDCRTFLYDASRTNDVGVTITTEVEVDAIPDWSDGWIEVTFDDMPETEIILTGLPDDNDVTA